MMIQSLLSITALIKARITKKKKRQTKNIIVIIIKSLRINKRISICKIKRVILASKAAKKTAENVLNNKKKMKNKR